MMFFAGWVNRSQQDVIEYLQAENRVGERHLRTAVKEYTEHYHLERNHRGLENELIEDRRDEINIDGSVECRERLGGVLKYYDRWAA